MSIRYTVQPWVAVVVRKMLAIEGAEWRALANGRTIAAIGVGAVVYAASFFLISSAWRRLLNWFGEAGAAPRTCHRLYARTQIARYLPGNVMHMAGRHVAGRGAGFGHARQAAAAVYEVLGLLGAAGAVALLGARTLAPDSALAIPAAAALVVAALAGVVCLLGLVPRATRLARRLGLDDLHASARTPRLVPVVLSYAAFFLTAGLILLAITSVLAQTRDIDPFAIVSISALSWAVGFITPGAPAGTGVREMALVLALEPMFGAPTAVLVALAFRVTTTTGDVLVFFLSFLMNGEVAVIQSPARSGSRSRP